MKPIELTPLAISGLRTMLNTELKEGHYALGTHLDAANALLIVEIARRVENREDYFPRGKWATIQHIMQQVDESIKLAMKK